MDQVIAPEDKRCSECREVKSRADFYKNRAAKDGLQYRCKRCTKHRMDDLNRRDPEQRREIARSHMINKRFASYGISFLEFQDRLVAQGGRCKACRKRAELQVDHCHAGGGVRGLLCGECNRALGLVRDDPAVLLALVEYLREHEQRVAAA
jgi:hypothetical protein